MAGTSNLGHKVHTQNIDWGQLVRRSWGSEFNAPDHGVYEFSNGRQFDSTDKSTTGIYNANFALGLLVQGPRYPDMSAFLLTELGQQINQG